VLYPAFLAVEARLDSQEMKLARKKFAQQLSRNDAVGIQRKGAELQKRNGRRRKNGSQTNDHLLVTQIGNANFFFAPWRLGDFALKSSRLTAWIRLRNYAATKHDKISETVLRLFESVGIARFLALPPF
jgi:hypothetical protein